MQSLRGSNTRPLLGLGLVLGVLALVGAALAASCASALAAKVNIVRQGGPPSGRTPRGTAYFTTIQAAVDAATRGAWVLIEPGVYDEEVKVEPRTRGIWIRGMNRNTRGHRRRARTVQTLALPGRQQRHRSLQGERRVDRKPDGRELRPRRNQRRRRQRDLVERRRRVAQNRRHGWYGRYLTAYDTGFDGGYGIFTNNETDGFWEKIYASGLQRLGHVHRRLPGMQSARQRSGDGKQRARLLRLELRRQRW